MKNLNKIAGLVFLCTFAGFLQAQTAGDPQKKNTEVKPPEQSGITVELPPREEKFIRPEDQRKGAPKKVRKKQMPHLVPDPGLLKTEKQEVPE